MLLSVVFFSMQIKIDELISHRVREENVKRNEMKQETWALYSIYELRQFEMMLSLSFVDSTR